jgi:hypothetical protein
MADNPDETELPEIVAMTHRCYREARDHSAEWRQMAPKWYDLVANRQWDKDDVEAMEEHDRIPVVINRVARTVNAILGTQVANRQETRYIPREEGDVKANEVYTGAADWVRDSCDAEDEETDAFEDTTICGMGWTETRLDFDSDPEGTITIDRLDPIEMYWDPNAKKRNISDGRWIMRLKAVPIDEFEDRWPDQLAGMLTDPWESPADTRTRQHVYPNEAYQETQASSQAAKGRKTVRVAQIQWAEREPMYRVGKAAERITKKAFDELKDKLDAEKIPYMRQTGTRWKQAFVAGGKVLEEADVEQTDKAQDCPYPDGPTMRCITYKRDRNKNTWYGVVAAMMDPQRYGNKFMSLIMDIVRANSKGGIMVEKGAVDNPAELEEKWAKPDAIVFVNPGAITGEKIKERPKAQLPAGLDRLVAYFLDSVHEVTGINLELLGMANREQAGVLENTRKQAGVTIIAPLFDGLRRYRKEQGRVLLYFIQTYLSDGRLVRILGENGKQAYTPLMKQPDSAKFDVIVDESPTSPNMKERSFNALIELAPTLAKMGVPMPPELLDLSPFPSNVVEKWKAFIEQSKGQPSPEDLQKMQEEFQKLTEENQQLKQQKDVKMFELQMDQQKAQQEAEIERTKMQLEIEKAQMEMQIEREKMALEREKAGLQLELEQQKTQNELALNQHKTQAQLQLAERQATGQLDLERRKVEADAHVKTAGSKDVIARTFQENFAKAPKRKFRVVRNRAGDVESLAEE